MNFHLARSVSREENFIRYSVIVEDYFYGKSSAENVIEIAIRFLANEYPIEVKYLYTAVLSLEEYFYSKPELDRAEKIVNMFEKHGIYEGSRLSVHIDDLISIYTKLAYTKANLDEIVEEGRFFLIKLSSKDSWISLGGPSWSRSPPVKWNTYAKCDGKEQLLAALVELLRDYDIKVNPYGYIIIYN